MTVDMNTFLVSSWPVFTSKVSIHLHSHSILYFPHLYLMPLPVTEMKRFVYTVLRYQLAVTVFCTEYDLKPLMNTLVNNFSVSKTTNPLF